MKFDPFAYRWRHPSEDQSQPETATGDKALTSPRCKRCDAAMEHPTLTRLCNDCLIASTNGPRDA